MSYGGFPYGGATFGGGDVAEIPQNDGSPTLAVEVAFATDALAEPAWVDITGDVREWDTNRGRNRELERFQPGRATIVLSNLERQYDSVYASGPWFGNLKPMRRVRIRQTFNGVTYPVFDGFVDRWKLDYPGTGKDATATLVATDAFKIFARTDLPVSVYQMEIDSEDPAVWFRLDDVQTVVDESLLVLNSGVNGFNATAPTGAGQQFFGAQGLIVHDPGTAVEFDERLIENFQIPLNTTVLDGDFAIECWFRLTGEPTATNFLWSALGTGSSSLSLQLNSTTMKLGFVYQNSAGGAFSAQPDTVINVGQRYHIVCVHDTNRLLGIWIDGVLDGSGIRETTTGTLAIDAFFVGSGGSGTASPKGIEDEVAIYGTALSQARITDHFDAGAAPWQDDQPAERLDRVLDIVEYPEDQREFDAGDVALQSAKLGTTALEHAQKVAETEQGYLFIDRTGKARLIGRAAIAARVALPDAVFGDETGEIGYRDLVPDDGGDTVRNRAIISRYNGVAKTATDAASVAEFGRFDYTLDGLLHRLDSYSATYAQAIVDAYAEPRRRIAALVLGPPSPDAAATLYPQILGRELGEVITVRSRPPGGGALFAQACSIEGIRHAGTPKHRTATWQLSPATGIDPVALELLQAEDGDVLETETGDEMELDA